VTICLVTDRTRLPSSRTIVDQVRLAVDAGIDLVQIRERDLDGGVLARLVDAVLAVTRGSSTRVVVNDRLDVALACGADGVHLREDSIPVSAARRLAPSPFLVGRSVHSVEAARSSAGADYLIAGSIFPTASKGGAPASLGLDGLRAIVHAAPAPVLAIGGVTLDKIDAIRATGAAGIAAIGLFAAESLVTIVTDARRRFDTVRSAP
jgi:thiamine-phosphate pyrophosphorylase